VAKRLANIGRGGDLVVASAATSLPFPPVAFGMVPKAWDGGPMIGVVPELDLHLRAAGPLTLTNVKQYDGEVYSDAAIVEMDLAYTDVDIEGNDIAKTAHGLLLVDGPYRWKARAILNLGSLAAHHLDTLVAATTAGAGGNAVSVAAIGDSAPAAGVSIVESGKTVTIHYESGVSTVADVEAKIGTEATLIRVKTPGTGATVLSAPTDDFAATKLAGGSDAPTNVPGGTSAGVDYWIKPTGPDNFQLIDDLETAISGGTPVTLASQGSGEFVLAPTADAGRFHWTLLGDLGTVELDAQLAAKVSLDHDPGVVAYAVAADFSDSVEAWALLRPRVELGG
jgi:hypothetical protein